VIGGAGPAGISRFDTGFGAGEVGRVEFDGPAADESNSPLPAPFGCENDTEDEVIDASLCDDSSSSSTCIASTWASAGGAQSSPNTDRIDSIVLVLSKASGSTSTPLSLSVGLGSILCLFSSGEGEEGPVLCALSRLLLRPMPIPRVDNRRSVFIRLRGVPVIDSRSFALVPFPLKLASRLFRECEEPISLVDRR
jgi:hypothetical protein